MGVIHRKEIRCDACGHTFLASVADSVNVSRFPKTKTAILESRFHRIHCAECGLEQSVEIAFQYIDLEKSFYAWVFPRKERHFHQRASKRMRDASPLTRRLSKSQTSRVLFGLGELREQVLALEYGIDDRLLEILKLYLIQEHPFVVQKRRLRIHLEEMDAEKIAFHVGFDHSDEAFNMFLPRSVLREVEDRRGEFEQLANAAHDDESLFRNEEGSWVNLWRLSPHTSSLNALSDFAATVRRGEHISLTGDPFQEIIDTLPRGNQLPGWAKRDLGDLNRYAQVKNANKVQDQLFEVRFGIGLDDDWVNTNGSAGVSTIWELLRGLPDLNVEGNSWLHSINQSERSKTSYYNTATREVHLASGLVTGGDEFEAALLHEVGHATQAMLDEQADHLVFRWLQDRFGWEMFDPDDVDLWVDRLGGYYLEDDAQIATVRQLLIDSLGDNTVSRPPLPRGPVGSVWNDKNYRLRAVVEKSRTEWWRSYHDWKTSDGHAFFLNHHYHSFMMVSSSTLDFITAHLPDKYAAMSPWEFFAELYAARFDSNAPDGQALPQDIIDWLDENIGTSD